MQEVFIYIVIPAKAGSCDDKIPYQMHYAVWDDGFLTQVSVRKFVTSSEKISD